MVILKRFSEESSFFPDDLLLLISRYLPVYYGEILELCETCFISQRILRFFLVISKVYHLEYS